MAMRPPGAAEPASYRRYVTSGLFGGHALWLPAERARGVVDDGVVKQVRAAVGLSSDGASQAIGGAIDALERPLDELPIGRFLRAVAVEIGGKGDHQDIFLDGQRVRAAER